jgi:ATP-dependent RNA helicase DeaD
MSDYVATKTFAELPLSEDLRRAIAEKGYEAPTPVQAAVLEPILAGKDLIVRSKTGTGKTAAFGIPLIEKIPAGTHHVAAVVLCNTRELAIQVAEELRSLAVHTKHTVVTIYGGASADEQMRALDAGASIVVGTPGRVQDLFDRGRLKFDHVKMCVLDEADEMLGAGFFEDVTRILKSLPADRQTLLFSATVPPDIEQLVANFLHNPETILLSGDVFTVDHIDNVICDVVDQYPKPRNLLYLLEMENPDSAIIFCNTRTDTELIANVLNRHGLDAEMLNGDLAQKDRERVMGRIKKGELRYMVATDLAARGIDISDLTHVINYSLPEDPMVYLHRVGRTGRIGKKGTAISLVTGAEIMTLSTLQKKFGIKFRSMSLPTPEEAKSLWTDRSVKELHDAMSTGAAFEAYLPLAKELAAKEERLSLLAYALKYFFTHHRMERAQQRAVGEEKLEAKAEHAHAFAHGEGSSSKRGGKPAGRGGAGGGREERGGRGGREGREPRGDRPRGASADRPPLREKFPVPASEAAAASKADGQAPAADGAAPAIPVQTAPVDRVKLFITTGSEQGWDNEKLAAALSTLAGQPRDSVLALDVKPRHAYVVVKPDAHLAYLAKNGEKLGEAALSIEIAKPRRR